MTATPMLFVLIPTAVSLVAAKTVLVGMEKTVGTLTNVNLTMSVTLNWANAKTHLVHIRVHVELATPEMANRAQISMNVKAQKIRVQ